MEVQTVGVTLTKVMKKGRLAKRLWLQTYLCDSKINAPNSIVTDFEKEENMYIHQINLQSDTFFQKQHFLKRNKENNICKCK